MSFVGRYFYRSQLVEVVKHILAVVPCAVLCPARSAICALVCFDLHHAWSVVGCWIRVIRTLTPPVALHVSRPTQRVEVHGRAGTRALRG